METKTKIPIQQSLITFICSETGHNFIAADDGFYKHDEDGIPIKSKVYRVFICPACGESKEICVVDRNLVNGKKVSARRRRK